NIEDVEQVEDATVEAHLTIRADVASSSDDVVVWDQFTWVKDADTDFGISSTSRRAGHDRVTGEAVDCCDGMINDEAGVQSGQAWPGRPTSPPLPRRARRRAGAPAPRSDPRRPRRAEARSPPTPPRPEAGGAGAHPAPQDRRPELPACPPHVRRRSAAQPLNV